MGAKLPELRFCAFFIKIALGVSVMQDGMRLCKTPEFVLLNEAFAKCPKDSCGEESL